MEDKKMVQVMKNVHLKREEVLKIVFVIVEPEEIKKVSSLF